MDFKRVSRINLTINLVLIILFFMNKRYLRANFSDIIFLSTVLGSLPNLIGAFMFSLLPIRKTLKLNLNKGRGIILIFSVSVFALLTYEEYNPYLTASKTFDYNDIIASGIGSSLAIIYYYYLSKKIDLIK
jgi:UDP:flavonoid glycosyltransferase YjiC (YdhE family)